MPVKALVIADAQDVANYLVKGLRVSDFVVDHAADGKDGMLMAASEEYDIMIVDRMLLGIAGLSIIQTGVVHGQPGSGADFECPGRRGRSR